MTTLRRGDRGPAVRDLRRHLDWSRRPAASFDPDVSGEITAVVPDVRIPDDFSDVFDDDLDGQVRAFQQRRGLLVDGVVGRQTWRALHGARWRRGDRILRYLPGHPLAGDDVAELQERLVTLGLFHGRVDGVLGPETDAAVRDLQRGVGLEPDGTCGPITLRALRQLRRSVVGGDPIALRAVAQTVGSGPVPAGHVICIDPGHGVDDPGASAEGSGLTEAEVVMDVARRLEGRLGAIGVSAVLTRGPGQPSLTEAERAAVAGQVGAGLVLSLHCDWQSSTAGEGTAAFFYGDDRIGARSAVGERLAGLLVREVCARTGLRDDRTHPRTWELLKLTPMPAVRLELGYLSNPGDAAKLADAAFRDTIAEALAVAIHRLYLATEQDSPTGALDVTELREMLRSR